MELISGTEVDISFVCLWNCSIFQHVADSSLHTGEMNHSEQSSEKSKQEHVRIRCPGMKSSRELRGYLNVIES